MLSSPCLFLMCSPLSFKLLNVSPYLAFSPFFPLFDFSFSSTLLPPYTTTGFVPLMFPRLSFYSLFYLSFFLSFLIPSLARARLLSGFMCSNPSRIISQLTSLTCLQQI
jgi:hypothetical protein